jgi:hypothetical protein
LGIRKATRAAAAIIKLNGGTRSRSTRGRIYYGPIMENDINADGATLTATTKPLWVIPEAAKADGVTGPVDIAIGAIKKR